MSAVTINKGQYYVGDPLVVFPNWTPSESCTYKEGMYTFHAFKFKNTYVAAIPSAAVPKSISEPTGKKKSPGSIFMTFDTPVVFFEHNGAGAIGTMSL